MDRSALWRQIIAAPRDEDLKTYFVLTLTQAGDPRAEIFRLAEELRKFPVYYVQHDALARHYESSLAGWRSELERSLGTTRAEINFIEGWPTQVTISAREFLQHATEIVSTIPLRHLNLTAVNEATNVFTAVHLAQIASLDGSRQPWSSAAIQALADSSHLQSLRWLDLSDTGITDADVDVLAAALNLRSLEHLDLSRNPCQDPVDAAAGYGVDGFSGQIVAESIWLPEAGKELEAHYGRIEWLHALDHFMEKHPPNRYQF